VAKFEAVLRYWCEGTAEYNYKLRTHGRNSILQQTSYKALTQSIAGAEGTSVQWMLLASPTAVCVCVRAFQLQVNITGAVVVAQMGLSCGTYRVSCVNVGVRSRLDDMSRWEDNFKMNL